jgi:glucokinase
VQTARSALGEPETLHTADHASFQTAWEAFRDAQGGTLPRAVSMAIAGPVGGEVIRFTNNPWIIRPALITEKLGVDRFTLVNDFAAVAHAVARADDSQFLHLAGPDAPLGSEGTISVIGPGTGLGVAHLWRSGAAYRVQATEGGHIDFAPLDSIEDAILARLRSATTACRWNGWWPAPASSTSISARRDRRAAPCRTRCDRHLERGTSGEDSLAAAAVDRFCLSLGSVAGDLALAQGGFAGVVIAGGLGYRIRETLLASGFAQRFRAKGRFESLMAGIPVKLIVHPQPGLFGAAAAFARNTEYGVKTSPLSKRGWANCTSAHGKPRCSTRCSSSRSICRGRWRRAI